MSDDTFTYDEAGFEPGTQLGGITIEDGEARYADLVAEIIWGGTITPESRQRLETARTMFGLSVERATQIEDAQIATHRVEVVEEPTEDGETTLPVEDGVEPVPAPPESQVAPIAPSDDPRIRALQRRIIVVEDENDELAFENQTLRDLVDQLENLVEQLQFALEETLDELHVVKRVSRPPDPPAASMIQAVSADVEHDVEVSLESADALHDAGPESGPSESAEIPIQVVTAPPTRPELPTLMGIGHEMIPRERLAEEPAPITRPRPKIVVDGDEELPAPAHSMTTARRRLRSHEDIAEVVEPVFAAVPPGVTRRHRDNPADIHRALLATPRDVELLRALYRSLGRADDFDRRWSVAHALVFLDAASQDERAHFDAHAEDGLVRPARALDDADWHELVFDPDEDRLTGEILAAIAPAVLLGQMTAIRASISPELLDPDQRVDHTTSTLQAVRCLRWGAAILGLATPPIYVVPEYPGCIDIVLNPRPSTRLGSAALSGRRSRELAFDSGRHLCWYRKEHLLGRPARSVRRLEDMFLAALMIGNPGLPITRSVKARVAPIARTIRPLLDAAAVQSLEHGFARFVEEGGRTKLGRWLRGAERTANRAGMLLCNDLWSAHRMLQLDPEANADAAIDQLIVYITGEDYSHLRGRLGIALRG
jgi:hypothetical protein